MGNQHISRSSTRSAQNEKIDRFKLPADLIEASSNQLFDEALAFDKKVELSKRMIEWSMQSFGDRLVMSTSFGMQSAVLLHMASTIKKDISVIWVDTGYLPAETYRYAAELKENFGLNIKIYQSDLSTAHMEALYGKLWESSDPDQRRLYYLLRKVQPMKKAQAELNAECMVVGLRRSQTGHRKHLDILDPSTEDGCTKLYPILYWTDEDVSRYFEEHKLPVHPLASKGYVSVGDAHSSRPRRATDDSDRSTRFRGTTQEECGLHTEKGSLDDFNNLLGKVLPVTTRSRSGTGFSSTRDRTNTGLTRERSSSSLDQKDTSNEVATTTDESEGEEGNNNGYEIFSRPKCRFCRAAKMLLEKQGMVFHNVTVMKPQDPAPENPAVEETIKLAELVRRVRSSLKDETAAVNTVPVIFFNGKYVGGYTDLCASLSIPEEESQKILEQASASASSPQ